MAANPGEKFTVYVAHSSLTPNDFAQIRSGTDFSRCRIVGIAVSDSLFGSMPCKNRLSKETYYRLYAAEFLPAEVDRILYLDPDIVINGSLGELYNIDFKGRFFAAASHNGFFLNRINKRRLKMDRNSFYVNAGVIMINLNALRKADMTPKLLEYLSQNSGRLFLEDQDVFNALYSADTLYIDPEKFNMDELTFKRLTRKIGHKKAMDFVEENMVIIHFNGKDKPWNENYKGKLGGFFEKNLGGRKNICSLYKEVI